MIKDSLKEALREIMDVQTGEVAFKKMRNNTDYLDTYQEYLDLFRKLSSMLGPKQQKLLLELEAKENALQAFVEEYSYRQGLQDAQEIREALIEVGFLLTGGNNNEL